MPKAILLDLDDTILSYESVADASWLVACRDAASEIVPVSEGELLHALKENARWFWSDPTRHKVGRMDLLASRKTIVDMALTSLGVSILLSQNGSPFALKRSGRKRSIFFLGHWKRCNSGKRRALNWHCSPMALHTLNALKLIVSPYPHTLISFSLRGNLE